MSTKREPNWSALVSYDSETGSMLWRERLEGSFLNERTRKSWNARYAGRPAGNVRKDGYVQIGYGGRMWLAHRIVFSIMGVVIPKGMEIDHINRNGSDNRWSNLRLATVAMNQWNTGKTVRNTSGFKGVSWHAANEKWEARMQVNGKTKWLGYFEQPEQAHDAYRRASINEHGIFSRTV